MTNTRLNAILAILTAVLISSSAATFIVQSNIRDNVFIHARSGQDNIQFAFFQLSLNIFELQRSIQKYEDTKDEAYFDEIFLRLSVLYSSVETLNTPGYDLIFHPEKFHSSDLTKNIPKSNTTTLQKYTLLKNKVDSFYKQVESEETLTEQQYELLEHVILPEILALSKDISMEASMIMNVYVTIRAEELRIAGEKSVYLLITQLILAAILTVFLIIRLKKSMRLSQSLMDSNKELSDTRDKLAASNKTKDVFISSMTHELRTPLNSILGFTQILLLNKNETNKEEYDFLSRIYDSGQHLTDLIDDILDFTRLESSDVELHIETFSLNDQLQHITKSMMPIAQQHGVHITSDVDPHIFLVADKKRMRQVFLNLISNAIKYNRYNGTVTINCTTSDDRCHISVSDTGIGMTPEQLLQLFTPFNRLGLENSNIQGTGIGLTISKKMVLAMNGTMSVTSNVNQGSVFTIEIPFIHREPEVIIPEEPEVLPDVYLPINPTSVHPPIITVGDQHDYISTILQQNNHVIKNVLSLDELLNALMEPHCFIIFDFDYHHEVIDWLEIFHQNALSQAPTLAVSQNLDENMMVKSLELGIVDFMHKPLNGDYLMHTISEHIKD